MHVHTTYYVLTDIGLITFANARDAYVHIYTLRKKRHGVYTNTKTDIIMHKTYVYPNIRVFA